MTRPRHPARALGAALATCVLGAVLVVPASAAQVGPDDLDGRKAAVDADRHATQGALDDTSAELVAAQTALDTATTRLADARSRLATARATEKAARAEDADLGRRLAAATEAQHAAEARYGEASARLAAADAAAGSLAADMYSGAQASDLTDIVTSNDPQAVADQLTMLQTLGTLQADVAGDLGAQHAVSAAEQAHLSAARAEVDRLKRASRAALARATSAAHDAADAEHSISGLVAQHTAAVSTTQARKADELHRLAALDAESKRLSVLLAQRAAARRAAAEKAAREAAARAEAQRRAAAEEAARRAAAEKAGRSPAPAADPAPAPDIPDTPSAPSGGGVLAMPVNAPMNSPFGRRYHPILHIWRMHTGQDFAAACGTPVYAAADGDVVTAGWAGGYGNRLVIDHGTIGGRDIASAYNHLTSIVVQSGHVSRGQLVAYSGTTGLSTGCHLHFEVLADGAYVNPVSFF